MFISKAAIIERLETVMDPEVAMDIWTMGLIYDICITGDEVYILMTYTTPLCPAGPILQQQIRNELMALGCTNVTIEITFDPPWKLPEALRAMMGV
ncbi:MAG: iron-sulfur cluster assembly protein [Patescibacteria group bacterium]